MEYEFASEDWLSAVERTIHACVEEAREAGQLEGASFSLCEVYEDVPVGVNPAGRVAWSAVLDGDKVTFSRAARAPNKVGVPVATPIRDDAGMSIEDNKTIVRGFVDALFTDGDLSATDTFLAPTFVNHDPPVGVTPDAEGMRMAGSMFRTAFPDWHSELHALIAEDDIVVERFTASGTQRGELMGVAPTGKHIELQGINIFRVRDGQITERWGRLDELALLQQLGLAG